MNRPLSTSSTGVFLISLAIQVVGTIATIVLLHTVGLGGAQQQLGVALLGLAAFYLFVASSINQIGDLRMGAGFIFHIAGGKAPKEGTGTYLAFRQVLVAGAAAGIFLVVWLGRIETDPLYLEVFGVFMALPSFLSIQTVYNQLQIALGDSVRGQYPLLIESIVRGMGLAVVGVEFRLHGNLNTALWGIAASYVIGAAASSAYAFPAVWTYVRRPSLNQAVQLLRYAWPLMGSLILQYLASNAILLFVRVLGTRAYAVYTTSNGFRILALSLPIAISVPLFPHLTNLHARNQLALIRDRTWRALRYTAMMVVPATVALVVYRVDFVNIFFNATLVKLSGPSTLAILALSAIPAALTQIISTALNSVGQQRIELYLAVVQTGVLIGLAVLLLPPYSLLAPIGLSGVVGAAAAVLFSSLAGLAINTFYMERLLRVRIQVRPIGTILAAAASSFLVVSRVNAYIDVNRWYWLAFAVLLGFAAYVLVLAALGELTREDVRLFTGAVGLPAGFGDWVSRFCWREASPNGGISSSSDAA